MSDCFSPHNLQAMAYNFFLMFCSFRQPITLFHCAWYGKCDFSEVLPALQTYLYLQPAHLNCTVDPACSFWIYIGIFHHKYENLTPSPDHINTIV